LLIIEGKHGAEPNLAVSPRRRAPHRAGHACRGIILAIVAFVHLAFAGLNTVTRRRLDCFFARIVAPKLWSAAVATAAKSTVPATARSERGAASKTPPDGATRPAAEGGSPMPSERVVTGRAAIKWRIRVHPRRHRMIFCRSTRWWLRAAQLPRMTDLGERPRIVTGAVAGSRISSAMGSWAAASVIEACW